MSACPDAIAAEWPFVLSFVRKRMPGSLDADDVAALAIEKALVKRDQYQERPGASLRSWLYQIARNAVIDEQRRAAVVRFDPLTEWGAARMDAGSSTHDTAIDVREAVATLEPWQQRYCWGRAAGLNAMQAASVTCKSMAWRRNQSVMLALADALGVAL